MKEETPFKRRLYWALQIIVQFGGTYAGHEYDIPELFYAGMIITWILICAIFVYAMTWNKIVKGKAAKRELDLVGNHPVPWWLDSSLDLGFCVWLFHADYYLTAFGYLGHTVVAYGVRSAAFRYNQGLVQLVDLPSQTPPDSHHVTTGESGLYKPGRDYTDAIDCKAAYWMSREPLGEVDTIEQDPRVPADLYKAVDNRIKITHLSYKEKTPMKMFHVKVTTIGEDGEQVVEKWDQDFPSAADGVLETQEVFGLDAKIEVTPVSEDQP